jgi:hypothetical protein
MIEGTDGQYYLQAGAILLPGSSLPVCFLLLLLFYQYLVSDMQTGSWRLEDKAGLPLDAIHTSGNVPQCMHAFFHTSLLSPIHTRQHTR